MYKNKRNKKGLFLSVELIVILVVITLFSAVVVSGLAYTFKVYKTYQFAKDVSTYSEAFVNFNNVYDNYPGDIPPASLPSELMVGTVYYTTNSSLGANFVSQGKIDPIQAFLVFQQLAAAKLITTVDVSSNINFSGPYVRQKTLPVSSFDDSLVWVILSDISSTTPYVQNSVIYDSVYNVYTASWMSKPRLVLVSASSATSNVSGITSIPYPSVINVIPYGAISGSFASLVDKKYDDGLPHGLNSNYVGENIEVAGGAGCTSMPYTTPATTVAAPIGRGGATPTQASYTSAIYLPNKSSAPKQACLMTIKIAGL